MGYPCLLILKMELSIKKTWMVLFVVANTRVRMRELTTCGHWLDPPIHPFSALLQLWVSKKWRKKNTTNLNSKHFLIYPETQQKVCFPNNSIAIPDLIILWNLVGHWNCTRELKKIVLIWYLLKIQIWTLEANIY